MEENVLMMPLVDDPMYVNGFEAGMFYQRIQEGETFDYHPFHRFNKEQIIKICELFKCNYKIEDYEEDDTWSYLTVYPTDIENL